MPKIVTLLCWGMLLAALGYLGRLWVQTDDEMARDRFGDSAREAAGSLQVYRVGHPLRLTDGDMPRSNPWLVFKGKTFPQVIEILVQDGEISSTDGDRIMASNAAMPRSERLSLSWAGAIPIFRSSLLDVRAGVDQIYGLDAPIKENRSPALR